jgi:hypothetical protein
LDSKRVCDETEIDHREKRYISHAAPMPIKRNRIKDHAAYLIRSNFVRRVRQPRAIETNSANKIIAQKWLSMRVAAGISFAALP